MIKEFCERDKVIALGDGVPDWYLANVRANLGPLSDRLQVLPTARDFSLRILRTGLTGPRSWMFTSCGDVSSPKSNYGRDGYLRALQTLPFMRLGLVGASFGSASRSKAWLLNAAQRRAAAISVRDSRSQRLLLEAGVSVSVVPDLAFLLPLQHDGDQPRDLALIMLRELPWVSFETAVSGVTRLAEALRIRSLTPALAWQVGRDENFCRRIAAVTGLTVMSSSSQTTGRLAEAGALYNRTAIIYSNRLHGLLIAAAHGAVPVAVLDPVETKVRGIFEDAGWMDLIADIQGDIPVMSNDILASSRASVSDVFRAQSKLLKKYFDGLFHDRVED